MITEQIMLMYNLGDETLAIYVGTEMQHQEPRQSSTNARSKRPSTKWENGEAKQEVSNT
jgi:hypothetical protein